ncbi:Uncharacterized conserved protein [Natronincola peptidivorans]|uniref:Uncharacterized conserved protein n=1 Tax=Natronincola peptidivorans TaxID=426128 RepID=A0A1I0EJB9_9FIRM|nr:DUF2075 domain-containing protein [Natronincola peptidivorans]SET45520.1 Uncharacterized conserved protein [Natronincola peptidivorans]
MNCCYKGFIYEFLTLPKNQWLDEMIMNYRLLCHEEPSKAQVEAWADSHHQLISNLSQYKDKAYYLSFEYQLPHEGGRRPDVIILMHQQVVVVEFKQKDRITRADIDQTAAYGRDLKHYHEFSHAMDITPLLIPTKTQGKLKNFGPVKACSPDRMGVVIDALNRDGINYDPEKWLASDYVPLPTLVQAARKIYQKEALPAIRRANSAGIPEAVEVLKTIAKEAKEKNERVLALVTGVPGAGKTLLGLQFVYEGMKEDTAKQSIFLSGNGPLVEVLQHALGNKVFVQPLRNYIKHYGIEKRGISKEHIVVFDEAQRAWDKEHVQQKHRTNASEPDLIIDIADRIPEWTVFLGLIGEGQEIHNGEEAGMIQWREALQRSKNNWKVVCPSKISHIFKEVVEVIEEDSLDLNITLRSHLAEDVTLWANELLKGNIKGPKKLAEKIISEDFNMYVTRDLNKAKRYCKNRYSGIKEKRYGLLASSKARVLPKFRVDNTYNTTKQLKVGPWFNDGDDSQLSCCNLDRVATEFACQGLELDIPIICWGEDMLWQGSNWRRFQQSGAKAKDPNQLRINSYRVLLTRGRDGLIIYVPDDPMLDGTYEVLLQSGIVEL